VGSGFCVLRLTSPYPTPLQVVPRGNTSLQRNLSGHPRLDALYPATGLPLPVSGQLADLIAGRKDRAFAADRYTFLCMTLNPIRSGAEARKLASSTARAADLLGH
jgi:hypothetical protein